MLGGSWERSSRTNLSVLSCLSDPRVILSRFSWLLDLLLLGQLLITAAAMIEKKVSSLQKYRKLYLNAKNYAPDNLQCLRNIDELKLAFTNLLKISVLSLNGSVVPTSWLNLYRNSSHQSLRHW